MTTATNTNGSSGSSIAAAADTGSSSGGSSNAGGFAAAWDEELCVDMSPQQLVQGDALLLLELVQLPGGFARFKVRLFFWCGVHVRCCGVL